LVFVFLTYSIQVEINSQMNIKLNCYHQYRLPPEHSTTFPYKCNCPVSLPGLNLCLTTSLIMWLWTSCSHP
jgi:hypothetical protein